MIGYKRREVFVMISEQEALDLYDELMDVSDDMVQVFPFVVGTCFDELSRFDLMGLTIERMDVLGDVFGLDVAIVTEMRVAFRDGIPKYTLERVYFGDDVVYSVLLDTEGSAEVLYEYVNDLTGLREVRVGALNADLANEMIDYMVSL